MRVIQVNDLSLVSTSVRVPTELSSLAGMYRLGGNISLSGIYFIVRNGVVHYVGQSVNVLSRIGPSHHVWKETDDVFVLPLPPDRLDEAERCFIAELSPAGNGVLYSSSCLPWPAWLPRICRDSYVTPASIPIRSRDGDSDSTDPPSTLSVSSLPPMLTANDVAVILGVNVQTLALWRCTKRHDLPYVKVGRSVRYRKEDLVDWISRREVGGMPDRREAARQ